MSDEVKIAQADLSSLHKIFTIPEAPSSTLSQIDQKISENLTGFLQEHIVAVERDLTELERDFSDPKIPEDPIFVSEQAEFLLKKLVAHSVHTSAPSFIGHMTSAIPYFMLPLSKIMMALNQNLVKVETSKAFTPLERQVLGMMHRMVYAQSDEFYQRWMHDQASCLGVFCMGGTIANITALWAARNQAFPKSRSFSGIEVAGIHKTLHTFGYDGLAVLVSERGHYSLSKAAGILGLGREHLVSIDTDRHSKIDIKKLHSKCEQLTASNIKILAIVGVAGASETGTVDDLNALAAIAREYNAHFHVDAAWGGPTLFSERYKHLLQGIEKADSVTIDAHKQLYVPVGAGMVFFKEPSISDHIEHHAEYVLREGSKDLGSHSLEGSRSGMALLVHSGLRIIGRKGYDLLITKSIENARVFADMIVNHSDFELITEPELNILTYRYVPKEIQSKLAVAPEEIVIKVNEQLNQLTQWIQKVQRARGKSFVSRTQLRSWFYSGQHVVVFRVVLANPLTTRQVLTDVLSHQLSIVKHNTAKKILARVETAFDVEYTNP